MNNLHSNSKRNKANGVLASLSSVSLRFLRRLHINTLFFSFFLASLLTFGQNETIQHVDASTFNSMIKKQQGTILDVRTEGEFENGHIKGAGQLNYYAFDFRRKLLMLPKDQPVYLYCNTGWRSKQAAKILKRDKNLSGLRIISTL